MNFIKRFISTNLIGILFISFLVSCSSYHAKSLIYQTEIENGLISQAYKSIDANKFLKKKRNRLLFLFEKGKIAHLNHDYNESNKLFNEADLLIENSRKELGDKLLAVITNPEKTTYRSEDFEKVAIHYYKSLNYIFLNQFDEALVEARRINLQLQKINEKYRNDKKNRYTSDAFSLNLQGLIYESTGNINDAFISYRNAIDLYLKEGGNYFGVAIPNQLKKDLLKSAKILGFTNEFERYSKNLKISADNTITPKREVIVFWENGSTPYKDQNFYTFSVFPGNNNGMFHIVNKDLDLNLQLPLNKERSQNGQFSDIDIFNVAFPKYVARIPYYHSSFVRIDSLKTYSFEKAQDYNQIAFKTLKDRTAREIGKVAIRLAVKKLTEYSVKDKNENLGTLLGFFNAITERADTRNWQTLPNSIYYSRIPLKENESEIEIISLSKNDKKSSIYKLDPDKKIQFINYSTPKSIKKN